MPGWLELEKEFIEADKPYQNKQSGPIMVSQESSKTPWLIALVLVMCAIAYCIF